MVCLRSRSVWHCCFLLWGSAFHKKQSITNIWATLSANISNTCCDSSFAQEELLFIFLSLVYSYSFQWRFFLSFWAGWLEKSEEKGSPSVGQEWALLRGKGEASIWQVSWAVFIQGSVGEGVIAEDFVAVVLWPSGQSETEVFWQLIQRHCWIEFCSGWNC